MSQVKKLVSRNAGIPTSFLEFHQQKRDSFGRLLAEQGVVDAVKIVDDDTKLVCLTSYRART